MFWSGNYIAVRELNSLLKEENVTLSQVLEADDILQECKADNKALMLFLTRPDILNELITLITEEPPKNVELSQQYRHASIACEVLTSHLSMLSDRLSSDTLQMNRLCDFVNRDPPLNPLLASYFSKTVEMLLEKSPKQDCYLYHIVCLRVLDFFKSRRDFLPNLLRHISTSAIADVFKYFIRLDDLFNKIVMEWFDEHQVLECLIQIVCGSYSGSGDDTAPPEKAVAEDREKEDLNHNQGEHAELAVGARRRRVAADNACALLCEVVCGGGGGAAEGGAASRTAAALGARLGSGGGVARLLAAAFTAEGAARARAAAHAATLLLQLLQAAPPAARPALELAVAPHLPLLHHALLHPPRQESIYGEERPRVGFARLQIAALIAELALSSVQEVCTTLLALGTPGVLLDLLVQFPDNNFLHSSVVALLRNALCCNTTYCMQYAEHLFGECDMLNRFMDLYEENENKEAGHRRGHAGHVALALLAAERALARPPPAPPAPPRFAAFAAATLRPLQHMLDTPLGGTHPAESIYEVDCIMDTLAANFDFSDMAATANMEEGGDDLTNENECGAADSSADSPECVADGLGLRIDMDEDDTQMNKAKSSFLELASQRFGDDMWDDAPEPDECGADVEDVLNEFSPWASAPSPSGGGEGWAQFDPAPCAAPAPAPASTPTAPAQGAFDAPFAPYWPYDNSEQQEEISLGLSSLQLSEQTSLANNLLTAMSGMSPAALATLVHMHAGLHSPAAGAGPQNVQAADIAIDADKSTDVDKTIHVDKTTHFDKMIHVDKTAYVDKTIHVDKPAYVDKTIHVDKPAYVDKTIHVDKTAYVDKTIHIDKPADVSKIDEVHEIPVVEASSTSPDKTKSSDPWQTIDDKTKPDLPSSDDEKKSNTDGKQSDDKDEKEIPQVADVSKSSDNNDIKSENDNKADSPTDDKGSSDIVPSAEENKCDNPAEGER